MDKKKKNALLAFAVATGSITTAAATAHIAVYDKIFQRYERPDYSITPGIVCVDRLDSNINNEEIRFYSDDVLLKGNYFTCNNAKGIVVMAHGIHGGADDYLSFVLYFLKHNFNVFSFNYKGTYDSAGDSTVGFCEALVDLDHAIDYILSNEKFNKLPLFLFGHSWGGYAVCAVLNLQGKIKACASVAGRNNGFTIISEKAEQYAGKLSTPSKPFFDLYQRFLFKNYIKYDAVKGINSCNIPIVLAHGIDDKIITFNKQSIVSYQSKFTNNNIKYYIGKGFQGDHTDILYSTNAVAYRKEIESEIKLLEMKKGSKLSYEEKQMFYKNVDHYKYSEVNEELMKLIIDNFNNAL